MLKNKRFIDEKLRLFQLIYESFGEFGNYLQRKYHSQIQESKNAKVSRGENHKGYPYLVLDFPRFFEKKDVFAFRALFWWGNYFSCSIHLKGKYLEEYKGKLLEALDENAREFNFKASTIGNEWEHELNTTEYQKVDSNLILELRSRNDLPFLKIAHSLDINEINNLDSFLLRSEEILLAPLL